MVDRYTQGTVVTANARLSRQMRGDYDGERRRQGLRVWESPDILPRGAWLERALAGVRVSRSIRYSRVAQRCAGRGTVGTGDCGSRMRAQTRCWIFPATVSAAAQAWSLVHAWEAPCEAAEFRGLHDPAAFFDWMHAVERKLRRERMDHGQPASASVAGSVMPELGSRRALSRRFRRTLACGPALVRGVSRASLERSDRRPLNRAISGWACAIPLKN